MLGTPRGAMWLRGSSALALPERIPDVLDEHAAIVDAIEADNPDADAKAIKHHATTTAKAAAKRPGWQSKSRPALDEPGVDAELVENLRDRVIDDIAYRLRPGVETRDRRQHHSPGLGDCGHGA